MKLSLRNKYGFLAVSVIMVVWLSLAQLLANRFLLIACLLSFLAFVAWSALNDIAIPVLLFFLPWSPLMKLRPGTMSFYTIGLLAVLMIYLLIKHKSVSTRHLLLAVFLMAITVISKIGAGFSFNNSYILFFSFLLFFPLLSSESEKKYDFYLLTIFFSLGIIIAAFSAKQLVVFPTIVRFVGETSYHGITRLAGYFGDPNFYSAHISAALCGAMILILKETETARRVVLVVASIVLIYCGLLSVSKSFFVVLFVLFLLWIVEALLMRGKISFKIALIFVVLVSGIFILSSTVFADLIDVVISRFRNNSTAAELTTGRTELWKVYIDAIIKDPWLLLFGRGYTGIFVGAKASHNTLIQIVYQFGLLGTPFLVMWEFQFFKRILRNVTLQNRDLLKVAIVMIGAIGPWIALDLLFSDEFFLVQFYLLSGIKCIYEKRVLEQEAEFNLKAY